MAEQREKDDHLVDLTGSAAADLGPLVTRKQVQDELNRERELLSAVMDHQRSSDGGKTYYDSYTSATGGAIFGRAHVSTSMYHVILVPTDGSDHAEGAGDTAIDLAAAHEATLHVISVADPGPLGDVRLPGDADEPERVLRDRAAEFATRITERAEERGVRAMSEVQSGPPENAILDYAAEHDVDLIVMGTRGRGGLRRAALGSVTDHVIRFGDVQVLVVKADNQES